ncbi:MAG: caspase family protein [Deltaproteobacteria bacterium]|nr:caspase family protein [Deltaproteobacteria bacterium]
MRHRRALTISLVFIILSSIPVVHAASENRTALVIGNGGYETGPLRNPVNDAADVATSLQRLGFQVTLLKNASRRTMEEAILEFGRSLKRLKGVGLFYYAGHGMQIGSGANYLIPVGTRIDKESDVQFEAVNAEKVLAEMANADNGLNIVLLDACRDNPFSRSFRSVGRGLAIVSNAPSGSFISYSTGANQIARDGEGRNSPYTKALLKYIEEPGLTIGDVFMKIRQSVRKETGQVPWELSSLEGRFYFNLTERPSQEPSALMRIEQNVTKDEPTKSSGASPDFRHVKEAMMPAIVNVRVTVNSKSENILEGSGFIISTDGYIFTNNHIVDKAWTITIKMANGKEFNAKLIGKDKNTNLALLKIKVDESLYVAPFGDTDKLRIGDWVLALGTSLRSSSTLSPGMITNKSSREVIQTDASINSKDTGGPLVNIEGKVIGINNTIGNQEMSKSTAIPINIAKDILSDLKVKGYVSR